MVWGFGGYNQSRVPDMTILKISTLNDIIERQEKEKLSETEWLTGTTCA